MYTAPIAVPDYTYDEALAALHDALKFGIAAVTPRSTYRLSAPKPAYQPQNVACGSIALAGKVAGLYR